MKKILCGIMTFVLLFVLASCGNDTDPFRRIESGDFYYTLWANKDNSCDIIALSESGKNKDVLIVPNYLDGHRVGNLGAKFGYKESGKVEIPKAKKIYYCSDLSLNTGIHYGNTNGITEVYYPNYKDYRNDFFYGFTANRICYVNYHRYCNTLEESIERNHIKPANVSYFIGEEDCYFIDVVKNEMIKVVPPTPYKEGYSFLGWYKEESCLNKWDFTKDVVSFNEEAFQETKLYAKWVPVQ